MIITPEEARNISYNAPTKKQKQLSKVGELIEKAAKQGLRSIYMLHDDIFECGSELHRMGYVLEKDTQKFKNKDVIKISW